MGGEMIDLDKALADAGMITITEALAGGPMDPFYANAHVVNIDTLLSWAEQQRRSYLTALARHDLKINVMSDDIYDFVLGRSAQATATHVNLRNVLERMNRD
jgi:hypothetical protein